MDKPTFTLSADDMDAPAWLRSWARSVRYRATRPGTPVTAEQVQRADEALAVADQMEAFMRKEKA